ncbi:MAG: DUF1343 domain-containing protein [Ignavibacterium sp.]|nr:DUF1343 domain-containing protein [Ignavibacterium sp.]
MNLTLITKIFFLQLICFVSLPFYSYAQQQDQLKFGADRLVEEYLSYLTGKKLGLIVNHTSLLSNGKHLVDVLLSEDGVVITSLFSPEHGIRGDADAGKLISDGFDPATGIKIISLYGKTKKPTKEMLNNIDILIYDIQDVGARFYTYISTLYYAIEAAAANNKKILVLDRPNPISGEKVEGPLLDLNFKSFVGIAKIPIRHGMTIGELALLFNDDIKIRKNISAELEIVKMVNWNRNEYYDDYFSEWLPPSPNINKLETAIVYPGTCLIEGTNISEGRGTIEPFLKIGAPFIDAVKVIEELNKHSIKGVKLESVRFIPVSIKGMSASPKLKDTDCNGIRIKVTDRDQFNPVEFGVKLISVIISLYPDKIKFSNDFFDKLAGTDYIRKLLLKKTDPDLIISRWQDELKYFLQIRNNYLLY